VRALVLHPDIQAGSSRRDAQFALEEAVALAAAMPGLDIAGADVVRLPRARPGVFLGPGKIVELADLIKAEKIGLVLVDGPVTPVQQRNLEREWGCKLLDRTGLILEIFAERARTREGRLQVDLAALSYQRTRLVRAWSHLERQRGGLGFVGGPGETQIEADRRAIDEAMTRIRRQLARVVKTRDLHRRARRKVPYPVVALVGYTNAGKSTLFNRLTGAGVMAKDMVFASLDPTMRAVTLPGGARVILSDTVGFISDLPAQLVAAFRATLEDVLDADLILHIRDIAHPETQAQARDVLTILDDMGIAEDAAILEVWNKADQMVAENRTERAAIAARRDGVNLISALTGQGVEILLTDIAAILSPPRHRNTLELQYTEGRKRAWLYDQGVVEREAQDDGATRVTVYWTKCQEQAFHRLCVQRPV